MIEFHSLETPDLERFLERHKSAFALRNEYDLDLLLRQILQKAFEFVPSESGSILLDDPYRKVATRSDNQLAFIASFGPMSKELMGQRMLARDGIAGRVYQTGTPYLSTDVTSDKFFFSDIDENLGHTTHSVVCVPIYLGKDVCGVLELINRLEGRAFTERDMTLLEIFAGYTSFTLQNALDAKRAHDLAKKDDLTGLCNDRWFKVRLTEALTEARADNSDTVLAFLDLDRFKHVNDTYGHMAGSQVLREVGFLMTRTALCEKLRAAIENHTFLSRDFGFGTSAVNLKGAVTASIGIAQQRQGEGTGSLEEQKVALMKHADAAMYRAKAEGANRVVVSPVALTV